jgi:hypothetical protein
MGELHESESTAGHALKIGSALGDARREASAVEQLVLCLSARGKFDQVGATVEYAFRRLADSHQAEAEGRLLAALAQHSLSLADANAAQEFARRALEQAGVIKSNYLFVRAARLQGAAALVAGDLPQAESILLDTMARAVQAHIHDERLDALVLLSELRRRQGDLENARKLLADVWEPARSGPFRLIHADARNVLAHIERDASEQDPRRRDEAIDAALEAYRLAWCDGPPFSYERALAAARAHLAGLGEPEPVMDTAANR